MPLDNPDPAAAKISEGWYTGDSSADKAVPHGMTGTPKVVLIVEKDDGIMARLIDNKVYYQQATTASGYHFVASMTSTNFYVGNAANYPQSCNNNTKIYKWQAFQ